MFCSLYARYGCGQKNRIKPVCLFAVAVFFAFILYFWWQCEILKLQGLGIGKSTVFWSAFLEHAICHSGEETSAPAVSRYFKHPVEMKKFHVWKIKEELGNGVCFEYFQMSNFWLSSEAFKNKLKEHRECAVWIGTMARARSRSFLSPHCSVSAFHLVPLPWRLGLVSSPPLPVYSMHSMSEHSKHFPAKCLPNFSKHSRRKRLLWKRTPFVEWNHWAWSTCPPTCWFSPQALFPYLPYMRSWAW